jgi:hypothetical protein
MWVSGMVGREPEEGETLEKDKERREFYRKKLGKWR